MSKYSQRRARPGLLAVLGVSTLTSMLLVAPAVAGEAHLDGLASASTHQRFIVKYRDSAAPAQASVLARSLKSAAAAVPARTGRGVGLQKLRDLAIGPAVIKADRELDQAEAAQLMRQLAADPDVEYVEVDQIMYPTWTPNDPSYSQQWGFNGTYGIKAQQAWDITKGAGQLVAVLDTGITTHSDLSANVIGGYDFISDTTVAGDGNGRDSNPADPGDYYDGSASSWHGTHVAGTVAAVTNNGKGVAGTAPQAKVVPVRVLGRGGGYTSDIADGIIWASGGTVSGVPANPNPAKVINLSLGGSGACGTTTQNAINGAVSRGTTVVIAAGNSNANVSNASPANCNNVIAVGSTTSTGARSSFSNYGALIDIAAPGSNIYSTLNSGTQGPGSESYASYNGTSMATPHVAGVVALMQSVAPTPLTPAQVESIIKSTATPFPSTPSQPIGAGIVNAYAAVQAAAGGGGGNPNPDPDPGTGNALQKNVARTGLSGAANSAQYYTVTVPSGSSLVITMSGGTGDADLYVRKGSQPTTWTYNCRPYLNGNNETCTFSGASGTYYVMIRGYSAFSGVSLKANW
ncbi:S8 family peptidase [Stenotrophomonas sp. Marseille-Q4652]|uniref:S8 family peptidase n=1 Tax=Stenotrophomonas sp. Marseille-Q4652 TaxID=2866595 RepID=UPI001CE3D3B7|nr:S8 family peptidase [Stenotrophomonas sp. Marseille-Q4652]